MKTPQKIIPALFLTFFILSLSIQAQDWNQQGSDIDGQSSTSFLGTTVSLSSDGATLAVGARLNPYVALYSWNGSAWIQKGSNITASDTQGFSESLQLSADGNTVAIGATGTGSPNPSQVRVYVWDGNDWAQKGENIVEEAADDEFGTAVSLSADGSIVAISAAKNDGNGTDSGHVQVYSWSGVSWVQQGADIDGEAAGDESGISLSLNDAGDILAISSIRNGGNGTEAGHVRVFSWSGSAWVQQGGDIDGEDAGDESGISISLSSDGTSIAIGSPKNSNNGFEKGHVRIFTWNGTDWSQKGANIQGNETSAKQGETVSLSDNGESVVVGSSISSEGGYRKGKVIVYNWNGTNWIQKGSSIYGETEDDRFGTYVSFNGDGSTLAAGAPLNDGNGDRSGHVRVFSFDETPPSISISTTTTSPFSTTTFPITFTLSESDTNFAVEDVSIINGTISEFSGSGTIYMATIAPTVDGLISVDVLKDSFTDAVGNNNQVSNTLTLDYEDVTPPSIIISSSIVNSPFNDATLPVIFTLSEPSSDFDATDITLINGSLSNFSGSESDYTATVTPTDQGDVSISVMAGVFSDGGENTNEASNPLTLTWDTVPPEIIVSSSATSPFYGSSFEISFTLSEDLSGFDQTDIAITNGTISAFTGSSTVFTATITPSATGVILVEVAESVITDAAGNNNPVNQFSLASGIPSITSFSPLTAATGSSVTISGDGFNSTPANNIVYFGDVKATVTTSTQNELTVTVPVGATYKPISVITNGYIASSLSPFSVSFDAPELHGNTFADRVELTLPEYSNPSTATSGDLDGDGLTDIITLDLNGGTINIFRNTSTESGDVSFDTRIDLSSGGNPRDLTLGDLDSDGKLDLVVGDESANNINIFKNTSTNGSISFSSAVTVNNGDRVLSTELEDIDRDGRLDIVTASIRKTYVHRNTSSGSITFDAPIIIATDELSYPVKIGDLDGDQLPDFVSADIFNASITIFRNASSPGLVEFDDAQEFASNGSSQSVSLADLDRDGKLDVINDSNGLSIFQNTTSSIGNISFTRIDDTSFKLMTEPADIDGDGLIDLAAVNSDRLLIYRNNGSSPGNFSFDEPEEFITGESYFDDALIEDVSPGAFYSLFFDADNDGKLDALVVNKDINTLSIHRNQLNETDIATFSLAEETGPATIDLIDATVELEVPNSVSTDALIATLVLSPGATATVGGVTQVSGSTSNDFTEPVTYVVTAANGTTRNWTVYVRNLVTWDGANWDGPIPTTAQNVDLVGNYDFSVNGSFTANELSVSNGNELLVNGENTLTVESNIENNGSIVIASGSSLITYETGGFAGNDLMIKRNTRHSTGKYSFIGTTVHQDASITGADLGSSVYKYNESNAYGSDGGLARWEDASSDELVPGVGYTQAFRQEVVFEGIPNSGTVTVTGKYSYGTEAGWNLVANPYPAAISVADFLAKNNNLVGSVYIWDDNGSNTERGTNADYIVANGSMATNTTPAGGGTRYNNYIGSGQGFFVRLTGAYTDDTFLFLDLEIEFNEDMREAGNNADANFFRETVMPIVRVNLTDKKGLFKQTVIGLSEDATTNEINRTYDAPAFSEHAKDGIFTIKSDSKLSLNGMPTEWTSLPLQVNVGKSSIYTISVELEEYRQSIYLLDKEAGQIIDLKKESYSFMTDAGVFNERFLLLSNPSEVLGVQPDQNLIYGYEKVLYIRPYSNEAHEYTLLSMSGKKLLQGTFSGAEEVNLQQYPVGVYLVNDGQKTHKIILK